MVRPFAAAALLAALALPAIADAKRVRSYWFLNGVVADRFFAAIGHIPINGIQPPGKPVTYRHGRTTYVVTWTNSLGNESSTSRMLKQASRHQRDEGIYTDRFLTAREKRSFQVLLDLARDADVMVVHRENPVCTAGITLAQARGIARGTITRWSQVTTLPAGQPDAIVRRLVGQPGPKGDAFAESRFGAPIRSPHTTIKSDGGVGEARANRAIAAVTSWSRVRRGSGACVVPIGGVAPSNAAVHSLRLPGSYPVQFVMHRRRARGRVLRAKVREYVRFLRSDAAAEMFRRSGVLLAYEPPPADAAGPGSGAPGPGRDYQGRPVTPARDDAAVRAELDGERLEREGVRLAFEPGGALVQRVQDAETCSTASGSWTVLEGWRYAEHGGGIIARLRLAIGESTSDVTVELPADAPGTGFIDGQPHARDPSLPAGC